MSEQKRTAVCNTDVEDVGKLVNALSNKFNKEFEALTEDSGESGIYVMGVTGGEDNVSCMKLYAKGWEDAHNV